MTTPKVPQAEAKIGAKIEFFAKDLEKHLKPMGFSRRARVLHRELGEGSHRCIQLINFQGDKWNEGRWGRFTINLGVCFPALLEMQKDLPGLEWISQHVNPYDIAFGPGGFEGRLGDALTGERRPEWPDALKAHEDFWVEVHAGTDLSALAASLFAAIRDVALPWLARRSSLAAICDGELTGLTGPGPRERVFAAILDGNLGLARENLLASPPHRMAIDERQWRAVIALARQCGVETSEIAWSTPQPHPMVERRAVKIDRLKTKHGEAVEHFLGSGLVLADREDDFLDAWVHEAAAHQLAESVEGFKLWKLVAEATTSGRRTLLLRLLERLPEKGHTVESTVANVWAKYENYHHGAWSKLTQALLDLDEGPCEPAHAATLLDALSVSAALVTEGMMSDEFRAPVSIVVKWLDRRCAPAARFKAQPSIRRLLDAIRTTTVARHGERMAQMPSRDILGDELADQVASLYSGESVGSFKRLCTEKPEQSFASDDHDAILKLKRWLRSDASGQVPLQIEPDDWGLQLNSAIDELTLESREKVVSFLAWFDATAATKPTKRWIGELDARRTALPEADFVDWLGRTLPRFARTELKHFLSAPGYLAFPGETSERVLLGLVHWAGRISQATLVPALEIVATAAFTVVPGLRMRSYSVGSACLTALANTSDGREALRKLRTAIKQKNVKSAIDKALESV